MKTKSFLKKFFLSTALAVGLAFSGAALSLDFNVESAVEPDNWAEAAHESYFFGEMAFELPESFTENAFALGEKPSSFTYRVAQDTNEDTFASLFSVFFSGDGTQESPYLISDKADLIRFADKINTDTTGEYAKAYYRLTNDINLEGDEWLPVGYYSTDTEYSTTFQGVFDGDGHTVSNFVITDSGTYIGFFGFIYNGTVKNLTISDVSVTVRTSTTLYAGSLVGRYLAIGNKNNAAIENCHAVNISVNAESRQYSVYAGGLVGYLHASKGATITVSNCSVEGLVNGTTNGYTSAAERVNVTLGGFVGYVGSLESASRLTIQTSQASVRVNGTSTVNRSASDNLKAGGFLGYFGSADTAAITLSGCFSTGAVITEAIAENYSGALLGYLVASGSELTVENCYTTSNVYARSHSYNAYLAGFAGVIGSSESAEVNLYNSYTVGHVVDTGSHLSEGGRFTSVAQGDITFTGCFTLADSLLFCTNLYTPESTTIDKELTPEKAVSLSSYTGYSDAIWQSGEGAYPYPVLLQTPHNVSKTAALFMNGGEVFRLISDVEYGKAIPAFTQTPDSHYIFSHWSRIPDGDAVKPEELSLLSDTLFFANFTSDYRSYEISFSADGHVFSTETLPYGTTIVFPTAPEKAPDQAFRYIFSHWSDSENGPDNCSGATVEGDTVYYAVYTRVENGIWDGVTATAPVKGTGTKDDPYQIMSPSNLYYLSQNVSNDNYKDAYFVLERDIDLGGNEWLPIGTDGTPFRGFFNGAGYTISNFKITADRPYAGIFGLLENATVTKLAVSDFTFTISSAASDTKLYAGGIAGRILTQGTGVRAEISECTSSGQIRVNGAQAYLGGIVGEALVPDDTMLIFIENCYSSASLQADTTTLSMIGGIAGSFKGATLGVAGIDRCYFVGDIMAQSAVSAYAGGIVGFLFDTSSYIETELSGKASFYDAAEKGTIRNCFAAGNLTSVGGDYSSYAGHIFADKNSEATAVNCKAYKGMTVTGSKINAPTDLEETIEVFYDMTFLSALGFDTDAVWLCVDNSFPVLRFEGEAKNVYRVNAFRYDDESDSIIASLLLSFRDTASYTVLIGAYDSRGKMIDFAMEIVENAGAVQTIDLELDDIEGAVSCTLSVVDTQTLALLEDPLELRM